jgi:predicted methyltransferase
MLRTTLAAALVLTAAAPAVALDAKAKIAAPQMAEDAALRAVLAADSRPAASKARDQYRNPYESLTFWGLRPGMTVLEVSPGGGWWSEVLAPYAAQTDGRFVAAFGDAGNPNATPEQKANLERARSAFKARFPNAEIVDFSARAGIGAPSGSADMVLIARAFHGTARQEGLTDRVMAEIARVLKPGGVLAVEQHRAPEGSPLRPETGYVPEAYVIEAAKKAGLTLDARSEINANPKDTREHPYGVWTLKPVRVSAPREGVTGDRPAPLTPEERAAYDAIGESDRMTLRFRKPG